MRVLAHDLDLTLQRVLAQTATRASFYPAMLQLSILAMSFPLEGGEAIFALPVETKGDTRHVLFRGRWA